ncbi:hypothetical protein ACSFA2_21930 [Variovorax sp. LT2P21]|uniref:hypothetical protein n=1 Tax=Variovorax sp. LT2P21 TaxID=3443731 RepID=UPI003F4529AD
MKNALVLLTIVAAVTACSKQETPPAPAPAPAAPAATAPAAPPASSTAAPATTTAASADLPKECQDYLDKVNACIGKQSGPAADAVKASMDQTKAAWASYGANQAQLGAACKAASDAFAAQAAAMKC